MDGVPAVFFHFLWVIPLILLIAYIGSPRFRGRMGEARVARLLSAMLEKNKYTVFNDFTIASGGGTRRIDHLVISHFGIFVVDTVHRRGTLSGAEFQDRWKQYRFGRLNRFDNPLHLNELRIEALQRLLQLPRSKFHSIVALDGHKGFKGSRPGQVVTVEKLIPLIRKRNEKLLSDETTMEVHKKTSEARLDQNRGLPFDRWSLLRLFLVVALVVGIWFAFGDQVARMSDAFEHQLEMRTSPEMFHPDGRRKSDRELWEDSLRCAYSADTGRCACYEPDGSKVELEAGECRSLAERGSILKQ